MPVLDGWQATRALKADPRDAGTSPLLALTAHAFDDAQTGGEGCGLRRLRHQAVPARRSRDRGARHAEAAGRLRERPKSCAERRLAPTCCKLRQ